MHCVVLMQVSGRLFPDSGLRRSTRLSAESASAINSNASQTGGNGNNHSYKFLSGFSSSKTSRSATLRKGQSCIPESIEEGKQDPCKRSYSLF